MKVIRFMKKINIPFLAGAVIILLLMAVSLYPEYFSTSDPYAKEVLQYDADTNHMLIPPVEPSENYAWGTDEKGRDLRSLIIYGCRNTMVMTLGVALGRLLLALPIAIIAGYKNPYANCIINIINKIFNSFPIVMIVLILSRVQLFTDFFTNPMTVAAVIMTVFGWGKLAKQLSKQVEDILNEDFIEGEIAIGKTKLDIAIQNVMPHIIPSIVVYFFLEVALVLLLLSQVGALGLILSKGYVSENSGDFNSIYEFDWASLLIYAGNLFNTYKTWLITYPALAFATSIIGFNLLGEGIRIELERRDSRIITFIKKIPGYLSPFKLIYEIRNYKLCKSKVLKKLSLLFAILLVVFFPHPQSKRPFNGVEAFAPVSEFGSSLFRYREYGVDDNVIAMNYLADKLKEYGIQPFMNKYIYEISTEEIPKIADATLHVKLKNSSQQFDYLQDYMFAEMVEADGKYELVQIDIEKFKDLKWLYNLGEKYCDKVLLIDARNLDNQNLYSISRDIKYYIKPKGIIIVEAWNSTEVRGTNKIYIKDMGEIFTILMAADKGDNLLSQKDMEVSVKADIDVTKKILNGNVFGIIPGKDEVLKDEIIIIGSDLNYITNSMGKGTNYALRTGGIGIELQLAKTLMQMSQKPDRTVIFAFWDNYSKNYQGAKAFTQKYIYGSKESVFYIDIGDISKNKLIIDSSGVKPKNKDGQSYIRHLKANLRNRDVDFAHRSINNSSINAFINVKQDVLAFDSADPAYIENSKDKQMADQLTIEDLAQFNKIGQMIIDTVCEIIYDE